MEYNGVKNYEKKVELVDEMEFELIESREVTKWKGMSG